MQGIIKGVLFTVLLGFFTVAVAQEMPRGDGLIPDEHYYLLPIISAILSAAWITWGHHIVSNKFARNVITGVISVITVGSGADYYIEKKINVTVERTIEKTIKDSVRVRTIIDTMALEGMQKAIMSSIQAREGQLDSTIKTLQDSVKEVSKHLDRHYYRFLKPKLDSLISGNQSNK